MDRGSGQATSTHSHKESDSTEVTWHAYMDEATRLPCLFWTRILEWVTISFSRDLPNSGIKPAFLVSPASAGRFFTTASPGKQSKERI